MRNVGKLESAQNEHKRVTLPGRRRGTSSVFAFFTGAAAKKRSRKGISITSL